MIRLFDVSAELPGWFPMGLVESSGDPPSLPISPILNNTPEKSVVGSPASSRDEPDTPSGTDSLQDALFGIFTNRFITTDTDFAHRSFLRPSRLSDKSRYL